MKTATLVCLMVLALAEGAVHRPHGRDDLRSGQRPSFAPPTAQPSKPDLQQQDEPIVYKYGVLYPFHGAQGKQEVIDVNGVRGTYFVNEPFSRIFVEYNFPRHDSS